MPEWPAERRLISGETQRLDGPAKVTGTAKYTADLNLPGLCWGVVLYSPYGRARIGRLELEPARAMPGVRAIVLRKREGQEVRYHGEYIGVVAAETEAQARDAVRAIAVDYERLEPLVDETAAMAPSAPKLTEDGNVNVNDPRSRGDVAAGWREAAQTYQNTFRCEPVTHACLETHGAAAMWDGDKLTVWSSTQGLISCRNDLAKSLRISPADVEVICEYMGGGFGSKLGSFSEELLAAQLAKEAGRPVKLMLDREQEHTYAGCRRSTTTDIKLGATADGRLTACAASSVGTGGIAGRAGIELPYIYRVPAFEVKHTDVFINAGNVRAMRAPGRPLSSFVMESAMDGLAEELGLDPVAFRKRNLPENSLWQTQLDLGAERIGWTERQPTGSQTGRFRRGFGCATTTWGGKGHQSNARVTIHADGRVEIFCGTQDIGTGTRTVLAVVLAETLGLQPADITVQIGHSTFPPSGSSGGSTTVGGVASAARTVGEMALAKLFESLAAAWGIAPDDLEITPGAVWQKSNPQRSEPWARVCARLGPNQISVEGERADNLTSSGVNGAQFAKVMVDVETGITRVEKIVACQDCGLIVNELTTTSQVNGAVTMGLGYALFEERVLDPLSGRMLNADLDFYKLPGPSDFPEIEVHLQNQPERGVIGVGEPPTIPTAAAIANAVANAIGSRVTGLPLTPERVLAAMASSGVPA